MNATLPALSAARGAAGLSVSAGDSSSSAIVPVASVASPSPSEACSGALSVTVNVSFASSRSSSRIGTVNVCRSDPGGNLTVPLDSV